MRNPPNLIELTERQQSILLGTVLGDGCLNRPKPSCNAQLQLEHGWDQRDWLTWKVQELQPLFKNNPSFLERSNYPGGQVYKRVRCYSRAAPVLTFLYEELYTRPVAERMPGLGRKRLTESVMSRVNDLTLAVWFCDDGGLQTRGDSYYLCAGGIGQAEYDLIEMWLEEKGLQVTATTMKNSRRYNVHGDSVLRWEALVSEHVPSCMRHKLREYVR